MSGRDSVLDLLVKKRLQNQRSRDLIDEFFVLLPRAAGLVENLMRFAAGQALVPEVDGKAGEVSKFGSEGPDFDCSGALLAGEMQGVSDDNAGDGVSPRQPGNRAEIFAGVAACLEGHNRLGREAKLIGDSNPDATRTDVEA